MNSVISILGTTLDARRAGKWEKKRMETWRPSVALAMQKDLPVGKYYMIYSPKFEKLKEIIASDIRTVSPETELIFVPVEIKDHWNFEEVYSTLYDVSRKIDFSSGNEDYFVHITTGSHVAQICMFLLNESHHLPGKLIQTNPVPGGDPAGTYSIIDLDLSKYDMIAERFSLERKQHQNFLKSGIKTKNKKFNDLIAMIEHVTLRSHDPILLTGPTGVGKSVLARRIYDNRKSSQLLNGEFVNVNCATLRGDQAMSVLFGHKKGAFTGAVADRPGLLKRADGGLLFLDEIGELGSDEQAMLLHAIEEKRFFPLGSDSETESSFELICGTNRDLEQDVQNGRFRADLLARINLWEFQLPSLAERREDIEPNLEYELYHFADRHGRRVTFNQEAKAVFLEYAVDPSTEWSGNFRDLNAMITRMATLASDGRITVDIVREEIQRSRKKKRFSGKNIILSDFLGEDYAEKYDIFDLVQLEKVIEVCQSAKSCAEAGKMLFSVSRKNKRSNNDSDRLGKYLAKFGLDFQRVSAQPGSI